MALTYGSWEYNQGPKLYIDSSGFESIDNDKNFTYWYTVTYSPVEHKRKVTDENGTSHYEYKYSFGDNNSSRKTLGRYTFSGKTQVTKTVSHSVTEAGYKDTLSKTFYIDANMSSNLNTNNGKPVDPSLKFNTDEWKINGTSSSSIGWKTSTKTGYYTESYSYWTTETVYVPTGIQWTGNPPGNGKIINGYCYIIETRRVQRWSTRQVPYNYNVLENSTCALNIKSIRDKISSFVEYVNPSVIVNLKNTSSGLNVAPDVYINSSTNTSDRVKLSPVNSGAVSQNGYARYYIPLSYITNTYKNNEKIYLFVEKGSCSSSDATISEAYAELEIDTAAMPYINLLLQSYNSKTNVWSTCCTIPYLNYLEIKELRNSKNKVSKNLFLPNNLSKTDSDYRIQLDTNMVQKDIEAIINFRIDVLSDQLIQPGTIDDKSLYLSNDTQEFEIEVAQVNDLKLNALGEINYKLKTHSGFLKQGANEISSYLKDNVFVDTSNIKQENITKNTWFSFMTKRNGKWLSNRLFASNLLEFPQTGILKSGDLNKYIDNFIEFKVPYKNLKPNSNYSLMFTVNISDDYPITKLPTILTTDIPNIIKPNIYSESIYDSNKISIENISKLIYSPAYKVKENSNSTQLVSEINNYNKDIQLSINFTTRNIKENDNEYFSIYLYRDSIKNVFLKDLKCLCVTSSGENFLDIVEPYNISPTIGRQYETKILMYYDGFHLKHINPLLYNDLVYLRNELDRIRYEYSLPNYEWKEWDRTDKDSNGKSLSVGRGEVLRASHFNDVRQCCINTYRELTELDPPIVLNNPSSVFKKAQIPDHPNGNELGNGVLQHVVDINNKELTVDEYFPEWKMIINLINRN